MGSMNRLSIPLFLLLCMNLSFARKFLHNAHHSTLHPYQGASHSIGSEPDPEQPDVAAHYRQIGSEPDPEQPDGHRSEWATMWSSGQVIAEEPPKGGSDPQDFDSVVLVAEPDHPPQNGFHPHGFGSAAYSIGSEPDPEQPDGHRSEWATMWSSGQVIAEEPPKGGSNPQDFASVVLVAEPDHPPQKGLHPHGLGSVAYSIELEPAPDQPEFPPKGMET